MKYKQTHNLAQENKRVCEAREQPDRTKALVLPILYRRFTQYHYPEVGLIERFETDYSGSDDEIQQPATAPRVETSRNNSLVGVATWHKNHGRRCPFNATANIVRVLGRLSQEIWDLWEKDKVLGISVL
jgi:hypothetical protein